MLAYWYNSVPAAGEPLENDVSRTMETAACEAAGVNEMLKLGVLMTHPLHCGPRLLLPAGEVNPGCLPAYELLVEQETGGWPASVHPPMPPAVEGTGMGGVGQPAPMAPETQPHLHDGVPATGHTASMARGPIGTHFHDHITDSPHPGPPSRLNYLVPGTNQRRYTRRVPAPAMAPCLRHPMVPPMTAPYSGRGHVYLGWPPSRHFEKDNDMRPVTQATSNLELAMSEAEANDGWVTPPKSYDRAEVPKWQQGVRLAEGGAKDKQPVPGTGVIITPPYTPETGFVGVSGPPQMGRGGPTDDLFSPSQLARDIETMEMKQRQQESPREGKARLLPGHTSPLAVKTQPQRVIPGLGRACSKPADDVCKMKTEPRVIPGLDGQAGGAGVDVDDLFGPNQLAKDMKMLRLSRRQEACVRQGKERGVPVCISPRIERSFPRRVIPGSGGASTLPMGHASKEKGKQRAIPGWRSASSQPAEDVSEKADRRVIPGLGAARSLSSRLFVMETTRRRAIPSLGGASNQIAGNVFDEVKEPQQAHPDFGDAIDPLIKSALDRNRERQPQVQRSANLSLRSAVSQLVKAEGVSASEDTQLGAGIAGDGVHPERCYVAYISPHTKSTELVGDHIGEGKELSDEYMRQARRDKLGKRARNKAEEVDNENKQAQGAIPGLGGAARQPAGAADGWKKKRQRGADLKTPSAPPRKTHSNKQKTRNESVNKRDLQNGEPARKVRKSGCVYCNKLGGTYWCDPEIGLGNRSYMRGELTLCSSFDILSLFRLCRYTG